MTDEGLLRTIIAGLVNWKTASTIHGTRERFEKQYLRRNEKERRKNQQLQTDLLPYSLRKATDEEENREKPEN